MTTARAGSDEVVVTLLVAGRAPSVAKKSGSKVTAVQWSKNTSVEGKRRGINANG